MNWIEIFTCIGRWHPELLAGSVSQLPSPPPSPPPPTCLGPTESLATPLSKPAQASSEFSGSTLFSGSSPSNANALAQLQLLLLVASAGLEEAELDSLTLLLLLHRNLD